MTRIELLCQYDIYLEYIAGLRHRGVSLEFARYKGILHGIGMALGYDYEAVERDITLAYSAGVEPRLAT